MRRAAVFGIDLRSLAAFRIGAALVILADLLLRSRELTAYFTDDGVLPRIARIELYEIGDEFRVIDSWSLHMLSGQAWAQIVMLLLAAVAAVCLLIGFRTRLAAIVSWLLLVSLDARNPMILNSGDVLLRSMLWWSLFLPLGARFSLDALRNNRHSSGERVVSIASAALLLQLAMMYFFSAMFKNHSAWLSECSAIYYALNCDAYVTRLGLVLRQAPPVVLQIVTASTFALELMGPIVAFSPWRTNVFRGLCVVTFWLFHLGLALTMTIGLFAPICMVAWLVYVPGPVWNWLERSLRGSRLSDWTDRLIDWITRRLPPSIDDSYRGSSLGKPASRWTRIGKHAANGFVALLLGYIVLWNIRELDVRKLEFILPRQYNGPARILGLDQNWSMFSPLPRTEDGWVVMRGVLRDGSEVNLWQPGQPLPWDKPALVSATYRTQRWRKYLDNLTTEAHGVHRMYFANWLQRRWNRNQAVDDPEREVVEVQLVHRIELTPPPGTPIPQPESRVLWTWYYE